MEILIWFIQNIFTPVILSFVTVIITIYFTKRKEKPVIIEEITKTNNPKKVILKKSKLALDMEEKFNKYLKDKGYNNAVYINNLLSKSLQVFRSREYLDEKIYVDNEKNEICKIVKDLRNDTNFICYLKKYEAYLENSNFEVMLFNIGKSKAYNLKIKCDDEIVISTKYLDVDSKIKFNLNFFDERIRVNTFDFGRNEKFEVGFSNYQIIEFYLVRKRKYNKKDEIVFEMSYIDSYQKKYDYYCCLKVKLKKLKKWYTY